MRKVLCLLGVAGLLAACLLALPASDSRAGALADLRGATQQETIYTPVAVWKDCQKIAMCTGCPRPIAAAPAPISAPAPAAFAAGAMSACGGLTSGCCRAAPASSRSASYSAARFFQRAAALSSLASASTQRAPAGPDSRFHNGALVLR